MKLQVSDADFLTLTEQSSTPDDPASGDIKLYAKDDGTLAYLDDASAEHVLGIAGEAGLYDASDITYTPGTAADWDSDADPGDLDDALNQLAERVDDLEGAPGAGLTQTINYTIDGGGSAITTGIKPAIQFPVNCTLTAWRIVEAGNTSGAIKIDLWKDTYANCPPTDADSICNSHEPEVAASGVKAEDTDLSDWTTTSISAGDWLTPNVDSCTAMKLVTLALTVVRS